MSDGEFDGGVEMGKDAAAEILEELRKWTTRILEGEMYA